MSEYVCSDDCLKVFMMLSEYLDRELTDEECDQFEKHINNCEKCKEFFESFSLTVRLSKRLECHEFYQMPRETKIKLHDFLRDKCQGGMDSSKE